MSDYESDSSMFEDVSMDRYACQFHEQFSNNFEDEIVDYFIDKYMFLVDHNPHDVNPIFSLYNEHHSEEMIVVTDDQDLIIRELEGQQFSIKEIFIDEAFIDQHASDFSFKDPFIALMESYV
jgi:hypothetical protein